MAAPTVTSVTPSTGSALGGAAVAIVGTNFTTATAVTFGGVSATFTAASSTLIVAAAPAHSAGAIAVEVTNPDGTSTNAVTYTYATSLVLYTEAEMRAFNGAKLPQSVTADEISACELRVRTKFEDVLGFPVYSTSTSEYTDGGGASGVLLSETKITAVTACVTYNSDGTVNETFDADDLSDLAIYPGGIIVRRTRGTFPTGYRNVYVTYTHGWTAVPADIKWAGLIASLQELTFSNISERATGMSDGNMTFSLSTAGQSGRFYGLPAVDEVLARYRVSQPGIY